MIDGKFLQDEILSDEELEKISGGTYEQSEEDIRFFVKYGFREPFVVLRHNDVQQEIKRLWKSVGIDCETYAYYQNQYYFEGKQISREYAIERMKMFDKD